MSIRQVEGIDSTNISRIGAVEWYTAFQHLMNYRGVCNNNPFYFDRNSIYLNEENHYVGAIFKKLRIGTIVGGIVDGSAADMNDVIEGSLLVDINGDVVLFETFPNIQRRLELAKIRPLCLKFLSYGQMYDVVFWEKELGISFTTAVELCTVKSIEMDKSPLWTVGIRDGDIIVSMQDAISGHLELKDTTYQKVMTRLRDSSTGVTFEFVGPRDIKEIVSSTSSNKIQTIARASEQILTKVKALQQKSGSKYIHYAAIFQLEQEHIDKPFDKELFLKRCHPLDCLQALSLYFNMINPVRPYSLRHASQGLFNLSDEEISTFMIQLVQLIKNDDEVYKDILTSSSWPFNYPGQSTYIQSIKAAKLANNEEKTLDVESPLYFDRIRNTSTTSSILNNNNINIEAEKEEDKNEMNLTDMIISRSLMNIELGCQLFWLLESEVKATSSTENLHLSTALKKLVEILKQQCDITSLGNAYTEYVLHANGSDNIHRSTSGGSASQDTSDDIFANMIKNSTYALGTIDNIGTISHSTTSTLDVKSALKYYPISPLSFHRKTSISTSTATSPSIQVVPTQYPSTQLSRLSIETSSTSTDFHDTWKDCFVSPPKILKKIKPRVEVPGHVTRRNSSLFNGYISERGKQNAQLAISHELLQSYACQSFLFASIRRASQNVHAYLNEVHDQRDERLRRNLSTDFNKITNQMLPMRCPLNPIQVFLTDIAYPQCRVLKSSKYPILLAFHATKLNCISKRYMVSIKDLNITRLMKSKEEINKYCTIKIIFGKNVLEIDSLHLESNAHGVFLNLTNSNIHNRTSNNNNNDMTDDKYTMFIESNTISFSTDHDISSEELIPPSTLILLLYKRGKLIGETFMNMTYIWQSLLEKNKTFAHIEREILDVSYISTNNSTSTSNNNIVGMVGGIDYSHYYDVEDWGCLGRRTEMHNSNSAEISNSSYNNNHIIATLAMTIEVNEVNTSELPPQEREPYYILFKREDDVKQDEFMMQLIRCINMTLLENGLDLYLTTYKVVATGKKEGIIEWIAGSTPLSVIIEDCIDGVLAGVSSSQNPIQAYLKRYNYDEKAPFGIHKRAMEKFICSCAGYCIITYLLDIGDRHLDNILMKTTGEFFHVDFSFIFGRDPKPFKSKIRFTQEMLQAMGGLQSPLYEHFLNLCARTFNILRKCPSVIMSFLRCMVDSTLPDYTVKQKPIDVMYNTIELFQLHLTDEEAAKFIRNLFNDSLTAVMPVMLERMHKIANAFR